MRETSFPNLRKIYCPLVGEDVTSKSGVNFRGSSNYSSLQGRPENFCESMKYAKKWAHQGPIHTWEDVLHPGG